MFSLEKKILSFVIGIMVSIGVAGCSGGGGGGGPAGGGNQTPAGAVQVVSVLGAPSGNPIVAVIDQNGGMVTSPSGSFTLTIPKEALTTATTFTIQPLTTTTNPWNSTSSGFGISGLSSISQPVTMSIA